MRLLQARFSLSWAKDVLIFTEEARLVTPGVGHVMTLTLISHWSIHRMPGLWLVQPRDIFCVRIIISSWRKYSQTLYLSQSYHDVRAPVSACISSHWWPRLSMSSLRRPRWSVRPETRAPGARETRHQGTWGLWPSPSPAQGTRGTTGHHPAHPHRHRLGNDSNRPICNNE